MSLFFSNNNSVLFANLGITSVVSGITTTQTIFDSVTGQTTSTAFAPPAPNYVLGTSNDGQTIAGNGFRGLSFGVQSLVTNASRIVQIQLTPSGGANTGYVQMNDLTSSASIVFRCLRGPSTLIGDCLWHGSGFTLAVNRTPPSTFQFYDFSPLTGSATYIFEANPNGASTLITINGAKMLVRQL